MGGCSARPEGTGQGRMIESVGPTPVGGPPPPSTQAISSRSTSRSSIIAVAMLISYCLGRPSLGGSSGAGRAIRAGGGSVHQLDVPRSVFLTARPVEP
jgi:hypothetical protein